MTVTVCSGFSPKGRTEYGDRFLASFDEHWPADVRLAVYVEEPMPMPRQAHRSLWDCDGVRAFIESCDPDPARCGGRPYEEKKPRPPAWREAEWKNGYAFRFDARKFCRQLFIPEEEARIMQDGDILAWLDGDVETTSPVPAGFVESLVGQHHGAFLGRQGTHSEIGFWAVRLSPLTRRMLSDIANMYRDGTIWKLPEWHSAFVWDFIRKTLPAIDMKNLTPLGHGHVWPNSPMAVCTVHRKGKRKYRVAR